MTTLYLKIVDRAGAARIEQREAWDCETFLRSVIKQYSEDKINPCQVIMSTREDYLRSINR